ncbi:TPA: hypothetical protein ACWL3Y_001988 [Enterococcus faecalis]|uniref:hypothetical protein n=1 Tax=Enterococcus faecalis TaxID=1351 RepID=UPI00033096E8|nr:hypothetical protein [Enterococcus faecalis]EOK02181.1 hypothetical protein WOK_00493 [Enterococcus faecalis EnGen0359]
MKNNQEKANEKMNISNSSFDKMNTKVDPSQMVHPFHFKWEILLLPDLKKEKKNLAEKYSNFIWWALFYLLLGI